MQLLDFLLLLQFIFVKHINEVMHRRYFHSNKYPAKISTHTVFGFLRVKTLTFMCKCIKLSLAVVRELCQS